MIEKYSRISNNFLTVDLTLNTETRLCKLGISVNNNARDYIKSSLHLLNLMYDECDLDLFVDEFSLYIDNASFNEEMKENAYCWLEDQITPFDGSTLFVGAFVFSCESIEWSGYIEKDLVLFDIRFNGYISALTFIISSAVALARTSLNWEEEWENNT